MTPRHPHSRPCPAGEDGYVIVVVLALIVVAIGFGLSMVAYTLSARSLTAHDTRQRSAQQAAQAGVQAELYQQSQTNVGADYNFNGGVLGLSKALDCVVPKIVQVGDTTQLGQLTSINAGNSTVCPEAQSPSGPGTNLELAIGNHSYYQAELAPHATQFLSSSDDVEFPTIVAIGCTAFSQTTCSTGGSGGVYAREKLIMAPIGPLQAIEGMGNVQLGGVSLFGLNLLGVVNGDVEALGTLSGPAVTVPVNTNSVFSVSSGLKASLSGSSVSGSISAQAGANSSAACQAGNPQTNCVINRKPVTLSSYACSACAALPSTYYNSTTHTFSMSSGSYTIPAGDYVFCNFNATGGNLSTSSSGPVRIFVAPPQSSLCASNGYTESGGVWSGGNFNAAAGISNGLVGTVNNVSGALDPSGLQIYVMGDSNGDDNANTVNVGSSATCTVNAKLGITTQVIGTNNPLSVCASLSTPSVQGMIIYAPTSSVTVNTGVCALEALGVCTLGSAGTFSGAIVGDNVNATAGVVTQDLDIANDPLYGGVNAFQPVQYVECSSSLTTLSQATTDTNGC